MGNLCQYMKDNNITIAAVGDPYRPGGRIPRLPEGFACVACEADPATAFILHRPPYDICPLMAELLMALSRETWFGRVVGSRLGTPEALESVLCAFYRMLNGHMDRYRRPVRTGGAGNSWWTPELANERKRVNAMRRRYQRARDDSMRSVWRHEYSAALARFRRSISEARDEFERECRSACSRGNVYSKTFREAFGRTRPPRLLPPLERPDGTYTTTHLESAALLLRSQIAVDDARKDLPEHAAEKLCRPSTGEVGNLSELLPTHIGTRLQTNREDRDAVPRSTMSLLKNHGRRIVPGRFAWSPEG
ncbi:hypothetical protein HPB50_013248 [Hyalomma asiaticum]|uniref:Uncharacterized protein n=1 Tax=Hyalomma asiaticum TaxID=266040 RepID=A0ACB7RPP7_HYAAI|nr:hypothetical protein HPB50_013248 [Hyalomma asiaticum]